MSIGSAVPVLVLSGSVPESVLSAALSAAASAARDAANAVIAKHFASLPHLGPTGTNPCPEVQMVLVPARDIPRSGSSRESKSRKRPRRSRKSSEESSSSENSQSDENQSRVNPTTISPHQQKPESPSLVQHQPLPTVSPSCRFFFVCFSFKLFFLRCSCLWESVNLSTVHCILG